MQRFFFGNFKIFIYFLWKALQKTKMAANRDREPIILNSEKKNSQGTAAANKNTVKKQNNSSNKQHKNPDNLRKITEMEGVQQISTVSKTVAMKISQTRNQLGWTQKQLAMKINEPQFVIADYESGKAIPSNQILGKLEKHLKVQLRGL